MSIEELRKKIDQIDLELLPLLNERFEAAKRIGELKKERGLPLSDLTREKEILSKIRSLGFCADVEDVLENLYQEIFIFSKGLQD